MVDNSRLIVTRLLYLALGLRCVIVSTCLLFTIILTHTQQVVLPNLQPQPKHLCYCLFTDKSNPPNNNIVILLLYTMLINKLSIYVYAPITKITTY